MNDSPTSLDRLHDVVPPPEIPWWPPAPGWYVVASLVLFGLIFVGLRWWRNWRLNRYRRMALLELRSASNIRSITEIIRRAALCRFSRTIVASKTGESWVDWLEETANTPIPVAVRHQLIRGPYLDGNADMDIEATREFAANWIRDHSPDEESNHNHLLRK